jgi:GNAT superfamily N-acetyltransferase
MKVPSSTIQLQDGTSLLLRLMTPADREAVQEAFRRLSPDSRYYRLWSTQQSLPDSLLNRFLNPEPGQHETWAALDPDAPTEPGSGGGSFWRAGPEADCAEISLTVADERQRCGVGTVLLAVLWLRAADAGVREFIGHILPDNYRMLDWMRALGAEMRLAGGHFTFRLSLNTGSLRATSTAEKLVRRIREFEGLGSFGRK